MDDIIERHYAWLLEMGYTKATPLEALALITSEIGEAVNECRGSEPTEHLGEGLADIVLRVLGFARHRGIDIEGEIRKKITKNYTRGNKGRVI